MNRAVHSQGTQKNTHTLFFGKIHRQTETPSLAPYSFPPSPFLLGIRIFYYPPDLKICLGGSEIRYRKVNKNKKSTKKKI
jgi:hypothetical protein